MHIYHPQSYFWRTMYTRFTQWIAECLPRHSFQLLQNLSFRYGYFGDYSDWEEARKATTGFDSDIILNKVKNSLLKVKAGEAAYERDSVLFDKIQYSWPLLAGLLWIATQNENKLRILDFGGSLGTTYYQNRKYLSTLSELKWIIVEQQKFVDCGKTYFQDQNLLFNYSIDECLKEHNPNTLLMSSTIQYIEKPYAFLEDVLAKRFQYIIIDRTPFLQHEVDRLMIQIVPPEIYQASYPVWFLNLDKFLQFMNQRYEIVADFTSADRSNIDAVFKGFIFKIRENV
jgi:putative methyltransferase (TIGR04325 family)